MKVLHRFRRRVPEHAHGERTSSIASGYFAVIKDIREMSALEPWERELVEYQASRNGGFIERQYKIVDVPLTKPLPEGWAFAGRDEAHDYIIGIEGGAVTSTMFRLI